MRKARVRYDARSFLLQPSSALGGNLPVPLACAFESACSVIVASAVARWVRLSRFTERFKRAFPSNYLEKLPTPPHAAAGLLTHAHPEPPLPPPFFLGLVGDFAGSVLVAYRGSGFEALPFACPCPPPAPAPGPRPAASNAEFICLIVASIPPPPPPPPPPPDRDAAASGRGGGCSRAFRPQSRRIAESPSVPPSVNRRCECVRVVRRVVM